jgi:hypothetical protein
MYASLMRTQNKSVSADTTPNKAAANSTDLFIAVVLFNILSA